MRRDIEGLAPEAGALARLLIKEAAARGLTLIVTSTLRIPAEQDALYAQGRAPLTEVNRLRKLAGMAPAVESDNRIVTYARRSNHESGRAFDIAVIDAATGRPHWDTSKTSTGAGVADYALTGTIGEGLGLTWGGRFSHPDAAHFELSELTTTRRIAPETTLKEEEVMDT